MGKQGQLVGELIARACDELARADIPSPPDEARLLVAEVLGVSLAWVMAHAEAPIAADRQQRFESYLERRTAHEPMAYILGHREFYGLDMTVGPQVLVPRPETELLVEKALAAATMLLDGKERDILTVDLGTGSGAVAIALAVHQPRLRLIAIDSSEAALQIAHENLERHGIMGRVELRQGNLLQGISERIDLLVANLPYIPTKEIDGLMPEVSRYEPRQALDGGPDGTVPTRGALTQAVKLMQRPGVLLFEIGDGQGAALTGAARALYPDSQVAVERDYAGFERILSVVP